MLETSKRFELMMVRKGFRVSTRSGPDPDSFGNSLIEFSDPVLVVRWILDRGDESVEFREANGNSNEWWTVNQYRDWQHGVVGDSMPINEQLTFIDKNWNDIYADVGITHLASASELHSVSAMRLKAMFPAWPPAVIEFEKFLIGRGLICQSKLSPAGSLGDRELIYEDDEVRVKVEATKGWRVFIANASQTKSTWFDVRLVHVLLFPAEKFDMSFHSLFAFVKLNWEAIVLRFTSKMIESTERELIRISRIYV